MATDPLAAAELAAVEAWPDPIPIGSNTEPPPFPMDLLPDWMRDAVRNVAAMVKVPDCAGAVVALGTLSAVLTHGRARLIVADGWTEHANWYAAVAMVPGSGKTPMLTKLASDALSVLAEEWIQQAARAAHHAEARMTVAKRELTEMEKKGSVADIVAAREAVEDATEAIPDPRPLLGDTNAEAMEQTLERNGGSTVVVSDEAGVLSTVARQVERGSAPNLDSLLQAWSGRDITVTRLSREHFVKTARAMIVVTTQPHVVQTLLRANPDFSGRGLSDRFMVATPTSLVGRRDFTDGAVFDEVIHQRYVDRLVDIGHRHRWGEQAWTDYALEPAALEMFQEWRNGIERRRVGHDGELRPLAGMPEKVASTVLRLALALHVGDGMGPGEKVDQVSMGHAIEVGEWFMAHALAAYGVPPDPDHERAQQLIAWLKKRGLVSFTARDVVRAGLFGREGLDTQGVLDVVAVLVEHDYVRPPESDWRYAPGRGSRSALFEINHKMLWVPLSDTSATTPALISPSVTGNDGERELSVMSGVGKGLSESIPPPIFHPPTPQTPPEAPDMPDTSHKGGESVTKIEDAARRLEDAFRTIQETPEDDDPTP